MTENRWNVRADKAQRQLRNTFWREEEKVYYPFTPYYEEKYEDFHYWWMAHAIDVLLDGYERTGSVSYIETVDKLLEGCKEHSNENLINLYYDDMEWMALATLRAYSLTGEASYKKVAETLWEDIIGGWNEECGGGIAWRKSQLDYKNTPANAPAVILALRLYQESKDEAYVEHAKNIFQWLEEHLVEKETGFVWDGMNREGDGKIDKDWEFSYNQGVYVGACLEFYEMTGEQKYLDKAIQTTRTTFEKLGENGTEVLRYEGDGDCGLFKGIFIRYAEKVLDKQFDEKLYDLFLINAEEAWQSYEAYKLNLFGGYWLSLNDDHTVTLATHLSGCKLMEAVQRLTSKHGNKVK